jgi:hypothetical protein
MNSSALEHVNRLRHKTKYWLIENDSTFFEENSNPFNNNRVPIMCSFLNEPEFPSLEAYESGNRSILLMREGGLFKAKGIGIPSGVSRPIYDRGKIYTHQLYNDPDMCHRYILWGFMQREEYECEQYGSAKAKELGQKIELLGTASLEDLYYLQVKDRAEMFSELRKIDRESMIRTFKKEGIRMTAYSAYYWVPSDIRVGELFFAFMFPMVTKLIDPSMINEYVEWLGSSCGHLLRQFHDSGALHGTWVGERVTSLGLRDVHSNSYTGNYLVDDEGLTMCDFDLSKPVENDSEKEVEKWALVHIENPLYYAGSYTPNDALNQRISKKNPFREKLAVNFERSVDLGYREGVNEIEGAMKREMLSLIVRAKELIWKLYGFPEDLQGQIDYVDYIISNKVIKDSEYREAVSTF